MGLDLFEFTLAVEEAFGLGIPDAEAATILTPGQLVDYLVTQLPHADHPTCREQRAFHALRRAGIRVLQHPRTAFAPTTAWAELLPEDGRRHAWQVMHHAVGASKWPTLLPWTRQPIGQKTLGDTARYLAAYLPSAWHKAGWTRSDIETVIRRLMAEELGVLKFDWDNQFAPRPQVWLISSWARPNQRLLLTAPLAPELLISKRSPRRRSRSAGR